MFVRFERPRKEYESNQVRSEILIGIFYAAVSSSRVLTENKSCFRKADLLRMSAISDTTFIWVKDDNTQNTIFSKN